MHETIFQPTHKIHDHSQTTVVRAVRSTSDGILFYTEEEWTAPCLAGWLMQPSGRLTFRGEPKFDVWLEPLEA